MIERIRTVVGLRTLVLLVALLSAGRTWAEDTKNEPAVKGQRVYTAGHSFHVFLPGIIADIAKGSGIKDHAHVGLSPIGGSRVIQHWNVADDKYKAKELLKEGKVDVLTLSPIYPPDEGIGNFVNLALEHNPNVRVTLQENWLPFDLYDTTFQIRPKTVERNSQTGESLKKLHAPYFKSLDDVIAELNKKHGKPVIFAVPVGQAVIALREKIIAGEAPGLKVQDDLFTDPIGHVKAPVQVLNAYCHYAVIYKRSPVGLPMPAALKNAKNPEAEKLNKLLQELAWEAVTKHPLSGVK